MKDDFISQYKAQHNLDDKWEKEMRENVKKLQEDKKNPNNNNNIENFHGDCDHPNTMENGQATIFYILVMLGGLIFNDRWLIWAVATIIYLKFITRHDR
jgi:hypothetical protein